MAKLPNLQEIKTKLTSQVAIPARDFGALVGMDPAEVSAAVFTGRLGVPTFQLIDRGRHMVACSTVLDFFETKGIRLLDEAPEALAS